MKKKRIEQNEIKRYFLIIAAFLSFMILSLLFFLSWLQQDVEVSSRKTVATNVERQSYHLKSVLDIQFNYLTGMASYMGEREDLFCQENKRLIQSIVKEQDLDLIGIMKADGDTYYNNGARKNVKNRGYFKKVMQGQKIMSQPLESKVDGRTKVILAVPIYRNGGLKHEGILEHNPAHLHRHWRLAWLLSWWLGRAALCTYCLCCNRLYHWCHVRNQ